MQIVIDIPKEMYENALNDCLCGSETLVNAIKNGTPLPKGHGKLKDVDKIRIVRAPDSMIESNVEIALEAVRLYIDQLPTIIGADKESEEGKT